MEYLDSGKLPDIETADPALLEPRATFVTLRVRESGELRGCRGECTATQPLIDSVKKMAVASAIDDPRFPLVTPREVDGLHIEISVLTPMHPIEPEAVEVGRHGLMLRKGYNLGVFLPDVPTTYGWGRLQYLDKLCLKAGLREGSWREPDAQLFGFETESFEEPHGDGQ